MHFQWATDDRCSQHVRCGRGLCWNVRPTLTNRMRSICINLHHIKTDEYTNIVSTYIGILHVHPQNLWF